MAQTTQAKNNESAVLFDLGDVIGFVIEVTEQLMKCELRKNLNEHGIDLTPYQWIVLYRLAHADGLNQAEIAELTTRDRPNITRIVDVMERRGLVERRTSDSDRRDNKVLLTEKGGSLFARLPAIVAAHLTRATRGISQRDLDVAKSVLRTMSHNLQESVKN